jgi:hypothetical protein
MSLEVSASADVGPALDLGWQSFKSEAGRRWYRYIIQIGNHGHAMPCVLQAWSWHLFLIVLILLGTVVALARGSSANPECAIDNDWPINYRDLQGRGSVQ